MSSSRRAATLTRILLLAASLGSAAAEQRRPMTIEEAVDTLRRDPQNAAAKARLDSMLDNVGKWSREELDSQRKWIETLEIAISQAK